MRGLSLGSTGGIKMLACINASAAARDSLCNTYYIIHGFLYEFYRSEHKFDSESGFASFWSHIIDAVEYKNDNVKVPKVTNAHADPIIKDKQPLRRVVCSNVFMI